MINSKRILAFIPARGGSKGIKDKNILDIQGKPMIAYTIEAAKRSAYVDEVIVSTDSEKIKQIAEQYGAWVPFLRPTELARDETPTLDVVLYVINKLKELNHQYEVLLLLQPTSPLRTSEDIDNAIKLFEVNRCKSLAAVCKVSENPILVRTIKENGYLEKILSVQSTVRRQDMPLYYRVNGSIYINLISELSQQLSFNDNEIPYVMKEEHSIDIDDYGDILKMQYYFDMYKERRDIR